MEEIIAFDDHFVIVKKMKLSEQKMLIKEIISPEGIVYKACEHCFSRHGNKHFLAGKVGARRSIYLQNALERNFIIKRFTIKPEIYATL